MLASVLSGSLLAAAALVGVAAPAYADAEPVEASLSVSKSSGLNPDGESITVSGSGYQIAAGGVYAQIGWIVEGAWTPLSQTDTRAGNRASAYSAAVGSGYPGQPAWTVAADGTGSFTWTVQVTKATLDAKKIAGGTLAVFTLGSHTNFVQPENERFQAITFAEPVAVPSVAVAVAVSKSSGLDPAGETITVTGSGFLPAGAATNGTRPPLAGSFTGAYVVFGSFEPSWRPSEDVASSAREVKSQKWAVPAASMATIGGDRAGAIELKADGTFTAELAVSEFERKSATGVLGVYTYAGGGVKYAPFETFTPISFAGAETPVPPTGPTQPQQPSTPEPPASIAGGQLSWGISSSFLSYVTGNISKGSVAVSGGATRGDGVFRFGQADGSTYDGMTGTVSYVGSVRFTGHDGEMDVSVTNPQIRIGMPTSASLFVTRNGSQVEFATLDLAAGSRTEANGAVTFSRVPAALTAAGRTQVLAGFATDLDPITFTIGAAAAAPAGATGTVASAPADAQRPIPATPPATTGITVDETTRSALETGGQVTISVGGFQPNEKDIAIVVYSTPILLGTVDADARGVATWTGTLPATLADGDHTLTFQGSVSRGIQFTLARATEDLGSCLVAGGEVRWGFKESFRSYIAGVGGWDVEGVAFDDPSFVWSAGDGSFAPDGTAGLVGFDGSLRFRGHGGVLDTTLSNLRVEFAGPTGYLVFDVDGETQTGEAVAQDDVRFVEFALPAPSSTDGTVVIDAAATTLTAAGAAAFGTYPAGEPFDAVTISLPVGAECAIAGGAVVKTTDVAEEPTTAEIAAGADTAEADALVWPWIAGGILLIIAAVIVAVLLARRRTVTPEA